MLEQLIRPIIILIGQKIWRQSLKELKGEIDKSTFIVGDFNKPPQ